MKALITGVAGFIGSTLATELTAAGHEVVGLDCFTDYYGRDVKTANIAALQALPNFRFVEAALQTADLAPLLEGVSQVFHLAAQAGVRGSWGDQFRSYTSHNVDATQRLLEAIKDRPIDKLVYASSSSVYGDVAAIPMREDAYLQPVSPYGVTKLAAEHLCHLYFVNHGVPAVSLRYFTVYGPRQRPDMAFHRFIRAGLTGGPITLFGDGEQTRDFVYVGDVARAVVAAIDGPDGEIFNVGTGQEITVNDVVDALRAAWGKEFNLEYAPARVGEVRRIALCVDKAREGLGWAPSLTFREGIKATLDSYRS